MTSGSTYYIRVNSWNGGTGGQGTIDLTFTATGLEAGNCADGIDNDFDGLTDCNDDDCTPDVACQACPTFLTQSLDLAATDPVNVCSAGGVHADNEYYKSWNTSDLQFNQCPDGISVTAVEVGILGAISGDGNGQNMVLSLWLDFDGGAPDAGMSLVHTETVAVADGTTGIQSYTLSTPVAYPAGATVVASVLLPDAFFSGLNHQMQLAGGLANADSYWTAPACGNPPFLAIPSNEINPHINLVIDDQGAGVLGDDCNTALTAVDGANPFDTTIMSPSADDNGCSSASLNTDMWFRYVATAPGALTASTCDDATYDTKLALYDACGGTCLVYNDDGAGCTGFTSIASTEVTLGQVIYIRVGGFGSSDVGTGNLTITVVPPPPVLNEIRIDQASTDNDEFVELAGFPGSLDGLWLITIGDGAGASGVVESIVDLTGSSMGASGYFVVGESTMTTATPDLVATLGFENGDNVTHLLVQDYDDVAAPLQTDLDTDDDGVLDLEPWTAIVDCVAMLANAIDPATGNTSGGELVYCSETVGPEGTFVPAIVERCPDTTGPWAIVVDGFGDITLDTPGGPNACLAPPSNDECVDAIAAVDGDNAIYNASATESLEPLDFDDGSGGCAGGTGGGVTADVWYTYTAPGDGSIVVSTCDTITFDSTIAVYEGDCSALVNIGGACDTTGCGGFTSTTDSIAVTAGQSYTIRVGTWQTDPGGEGTFSITFTAAGDECDAALVAVDGDNDIDTTSFTNSADAVDDTTCDPGSFGQIVQDGWWSYTATGDGTLSVSTCDSIDFDSDIALYSGDCTALTQIACGGDTAGCNGFTTTVETAVSAGDTVLIRIGGWSPGEAGIGTFNITVTPDAVDPVASATATYLDLGGNPVTGSAFANFLNIQIDDASDNGGDSAATYTIDLQGSGLPPETFTVGDANNSPYTVSISAPAALGDDLLGLTVTPVITVTNLINSDTITLDTVTIYGVGDSNGNLASGGSTSAFDDILYLLAYMYQGGPATPCERVNDVNNDGSADLGDVIYGLYYLFAGGAPPIAGTSIECGL